jgi:hypothetical protein
MFLVPAFAQDQSAVKKPAASAKKVVADPTLPPAAQAALRKVSEDRLREHVRFLSHDLLEGRGTGQRGGDIAAEYLASQFALYGLKPAGDNGTYMQKVPLVGVTTLPQTSFTLVPSKGEPMKLAFKDDYVVYNETLADKEDLDAEIVMWTLEEKCC